MNKQGVKTHVDFDARIFSFLRQLKPPNGFQTEPEWFLGLKRKVEELILHTVLFRPKLMQIFDSDLSNKAGT